MTKTIALEQQKALAWLTKQLRWERALNELRGGATVEPVRKAA